MSGPYQPTQRKASKTAVLRAGDDMRLGAAAHMIAPTAWQPERLTRRWSERRTDTAIQSQPKIVNATGTKRAQRRTPLSPKRSQG